MYSYWPCVDFIILLLTVYKNEGHYCTPPGTVLTLLYSYCLLRRMKDCFDFIVLLLPVEKNERLFWLYCTPTACWEEWKTVLTLLYSYCLLRRMKDCIDFIVLLLLVEKNERLFWLYCTLTSTVLTLIVLLLTVYKNVRLLALLYSYWLFVRMRDYLNIFVLPLALYWLYCTPAGCLWEWETEFIVFLLLD